MITFDKNTELLSKLLDLTSTKNKVIANNIANVNTPGYEKLEVTFEKELQNAIEGGSIAKIKSIKEKIELSKDIGNGNGGNNVDIDTEMIEFFKSSDKHNMYLEILAKKFKGLIYAIESK
ncbi:MAG: flagellar basal body rod protein FlgB [Candidatus Scalindua sp. AMX11]|nr:MAG: flagellar basal body rod protein FlgB [Candidatus Scalindua sp.]NOG85769.1 flagellar basal body rod protein FlgB [Planctomycetota bacterium]RZV97055.1 MAG: flagellar basal body rod protein FlgB [Candidatus Scalindua sp. SCAELEC01]TDE66331.1 MAG: flagellar basal body rod protein FlgB [Candidatus Scalindua sp. AMX11]GJQ58277.1 MAG: flagellar basal body rod protein FlgB [Candidatus Scalindua sp.]